MLDKFLAVLLALVTSLALISAVVVAQMDEDLSIPVSVVTYVEE